MLQKGKLTEQDLAMIINDETYIDYIDRLKLLAISLFNWDNLDKICGTGANDFLEKVLYENGRGVFVKDKTKGFMALRVNPCDKWNVYEMPTKVEAWSLGYNEKYLLDEVVYIKNNLLEKPTFETLKLIAYRLYDTTRTGDINLNSLKTPILIEGDTKTILTLKNVYMQYTGNIPVVFGNKQFDISNKLNVLKTDAPYLLDKLDIHKHEIFNEALTFLGIDNANTDKKERLITDEVESNNQLINYSLNCFYKTRKRACDEINEKFLKNEKYKLSISLNQEVMDLLNISENDIIDVEGDEENGTLHDND